MKANYKFSIVVLLVFSTLLLSCGGSDITPPGIIVQKIDLNNLIGERDGEVEISLTFGSSTIVEKTSQVVIYKSDKTSNALEINFRTPFICDTKNNVRIMKSKTQKDEDVLLLELDNYMPTKQSYVGDTEIPDYIKELFPDNNDFAKIEIGEFTYQNKEEQKGKYNTSKKALTFTYTASIKLYAKNDLTKPAGSSTLKFEYTFPIASK